MNKATFRGVVEQITPYNQFTVDGETYRYRTVVIHLVGSEYNKVAGNFIAANVWQDMDIPDLGALVEVEVRVSSERNRKDPNLFYHKINLQTIKELKYDQLHQDVLNEEGRRSFSKVGDRSVNQLQDFYY